MGKIIVILVGLCIAAGASASEKKVSRKIASANAKTGTSVVYNMEYQPEILVISIEGEAAKAVFDSLPTSSASVSNARIHKNISCISSPVYQCTVEFKDGVADVSPVFSRI